MHSTSGYCYTILDLFSNSYDTPLYTLPLLSLSLHMMIYYPPLIFILIFILILCKYYLLLCCCCVVVVCWCTLLNRSNSNTSQLMYSSSWLSVSISGKSGSAGSRVVFLVASA